MVLLCHVVRKLGVVVSRTDLAVSRTGKSCQGVVACDECVVMMMMMVPSIGAPTCSGPFRNMPNRGRHRSESESAEVNPRRARGRHDAARTNDTQRETRNARDGPPTTDGVAPGTPAGQILMTGLRTLGSAMRQLQMMKRKCAPMKYRPMPGVSVHGAVLVGFRHLETMQMKMMT